MPRHRLLFLAASCALPFALVACGESAPPDPRDQAPLVRTVAVSSSAPAERVFTGTVAAKVQSDLGFRVPGKVLERLVDSGQVVKRGQRLFRLDPADLKLAALAQDEAVAAAKARFQQASDEEARYRDLRGTGAISVSAYDQVKAAANAAKAQLKVAEAQADVARNTSGYSELFADADGIVMETLAEPGQVVSAGQAVVRIAHAGKREAIIQLPESTRPALGTVAQAALFGKESAPVPAKLRQLSEVADRVTRTFEARYVLEGDLANAPLGTTVTVQMPANAQAAKAGLQVPISAILDAGKGSAVWRVLDGKVSRQPVVVVQLQDDKAYVTGALKAGDRIVSLGAHLLTDGAQVRLADEAATAAPVRAGAARE